MMGFYVNVKQLMMALLPKPKRRPDILEVDRAESLKELGIVKEGYRVC